MASFRRRRCASCRTPLPAAASPRRRYCSPRCVAAAYRERRRRQRLGEVGRIVALATKTYVADDEVAAVWAAYDVYTWRRMRCPVCRTPILKGATVRADAVYCSPRCRTRAWRARQAAAAIHNR